VRELLQGFHRAHDFLGRGVQVQRHATSCLSRSISHARSFLSHLESGSRCRRTAARRRQRRGPSGATAGVMAGAIGRRKRPRPPGDARCRNTPRAD
jgi:hypothetical protein